MKKEYGCSHGDSINCKYSFTKNMETDIEKLNCNRILTIDSVLSNSYTMKEMIWTWTDDMIKCLAKDDIKSEPITSRFDILDIR